MSDSIQVTGLREVVDYLNRLPDELFEDTKEIFKERTFSAHRKVTNRLTGTPMKSRTGLLRKSIRTQVVGTKLGNLKAGIFAAANVRGTQIKYAPIHEYGGTITARNAYQNVKGGPYLNIPTDANRTPAGVMRFTPNEVFKNMGGYIAGRGVFIPGDESGEGVCMFALVKSVKIKARLGMRDAVENEIPTLLSQLRSLEL